MMQRAGSQPKMRRFRTRSLVISGAAAAILPAAVALASSAAAATGLAITHGSCSVSSYFFQCQIDWAGGTDPVTVQWVALEDSSIGGSETNPQTRLSLAEGNCIPGGFFEVKATVTDAAGLSASTFLGGYCDA
jgi:hypothetical protein